jgi:hypothetical protein
MKKALLFALSIVFTGALFAQQCEADYDFGGAAFGVSPDPELGESFEVGILNEFYTDTIHIKVPTDGGDIDPNFTGAPIDSVTFLTVEFVQGGNTFTIDDMGLAIACNNNGASPDPCTFLGGEQYCALLEGSPQQEGTFQMIIKVEGHVSIFGNPLSQEVEFDQYTYIVNNGTSVIEQRATPFTLGVNVPNPANDQTTISFSSPANDMAHITVMNLLGENVVDLHVEATRGSNEVLLDVAHLNNGIYLYGVEIEGKRLTKRMVIQK